jgi:D-glycero-alpha-D-manno-heptose-7-phosphate kinase
MVYTLRDGIVSGDIHMVGDILHESWMMKKSLSSGISNSSIDDTYQRACKAGARGGKLLGAGGGGFLVFSAPQERHEAIVASLAPMTHVDFKFDTLGSTIVFYQPS